MEDRLEPSELSDLVPPAELEGRKWKLGGKKRVRVKVTRELIEKGEQAIARLCPVAIAMKNALKAKEVYVCSEFAQVFFQDSKRIYRFHTDMSCWIQEYDRFGTIMRPIEFDCEI